MSDAVLAPSSTNTHALNDMPVGPDWPTLSQPEIVQLLREFPDAGTVESISFISPRPFAAASIVETSKGRLFVKRHHRSVRTPAGLREEHCFLAHLRSGGLNVPRVLGTRQGETALSFGEWTFEVHEVMPGIDLYRDALSWTPFRCATHAHAAGVALARLHQASVSYSAPPRSTQPLVSSFSILAVENLWSELERYIQQRPALEKYIQTRNWHEDIERAILPLHRSLLIHRDGLTPLWGHNDLHSSNLLWRRNGEDAEVSAIIDFGLADCTSAVYDIATALERNTIEWLGLPSGHTNYVHYDQIAALLSGYESVLPLSPEQAAALPELLPLVHVEYALSEIDYFFGAVHSEEKSALAYDAYLLGHAVWFQNEGAPVLDFLRRRAQNATQVGR